MQEILRKKIPPELDTLISKTNPAIFKYQAITMLFSKHPLVLPLFLIAAASPVASAVKQAFESKNELKAAADSYCAGTFNAEDVTKYG